jgi:hypothetical protein
MERIMKSNSAKLDRAILALSAAVFLSPLAAHAQNCDLPPFPTGATTTTQDRDHMSCQLGITLPTLSPRIQSEDASGRTDIQGHLQL